MHGQIGSACLSNHLKRTVFLARGQVVLPKSFLSSLCIYLKNISIQLEKVIKSPAHLKVNAQVEKLRYISKVPSPQDNTQGEP